MQANCGQPAPPSGKVSDSLNYITTDSERHLRFAGIIGTGADFLGRAYAE